ncbi:MAG: 4-alpha-glucanotransferase [Prevotella sp.]|nr:4-alpha-glucanotransferase [Prevotella sp.]
MTILLNLSYNTVFGEEIVVNLIKGDNAQDIVQQKMNTLNGSEWSCRINVPEGIDLVNYFYSVEKNGVTSRQEWQLQPHILKLSASKSTTFVVYDHWNDIPEDAYMYSSAITDCVSKRAKSKTVKTTSSQAIIIKTKAPQLRATERLAIMGDGKVFGNWEATKAIQMEEFAPNEWMAVIDAKKVKGNRLEFKFVALDEKIDYTPLWETRNNRTIDLPQLKDDETVVYDLDIAFFPIFAWKAAGVVVPIFSLRSEGSFGVGDFGDLKLMVDWAAKTSQRVIQILPIYDTTITNTWTDSYPYNSISIYALHPQYADLRQLPELKDAEAKERMETLRKELNALPQIDYERVNNAKREYLRLLFEQEFAATSKKATFKKFFDDNKEWLVPYAAFSFYHEKYGTATFSEWPDHHTLPDDERKKMGKAGTKEYKAVAYWYFIQYILDSQLRDAHSYAQANRVLLKGDIPIGISRDGVEAWVEPKYFNLNGQAGAPPDAFSANGQNWGFPTYNWDAMLADGCSWWVRRFRKMAEFFDAYRIDHVLGFFRIWEIPANAVHGLLGQFAPSLGMTREEIEGYGLRFDEDRYTRPFITDWTLDRIFHEDADKVKEIFLDRLDDERYQMKPEYDTQRKVEAWYKEMKNDAQPDSSFFILHSSFKLEDLRDGLYALISDVLFLRDHKDPNKFHPRIGVQLDFIYEQLWDNDKYNFNRLYNDYFYRRNNQFWYQEAMKKMPKLTQATRMLVCAEDLGMVPDCVPWVMNQLRILSLEIQSMPKDDKVRFGHLSRNPYRSVCTISTHDMSTLRQWWDEDNERTQDYYNSMLHRGGAAPHPLPGWLAKEIVSRHLTSPSMLCLLSLQDWLSIDEHLRLADADAERINIPANPRHYWRYRMHLTIEQLLASEDFNQTIKELVKNSGRG